MRRRPALCLLTAVLALVTAVALLGTGLAMGNPRVADPRPAATEAVVRAFYDALNTAIATGDPRALDAVVAAQLVTDGALATLAPGRDGLVRYLASLHATNPQLELAVEEVVATRDQAVVHLAVRGREEASFLGHSLRGGLPPWGAVDALAVAGHQVVEYWGGANGLALLEPLGQASLAVAAPTSQVVSLDRLTVQPGATFAAMGTGEALLLFVETGTVTVTASPLAVDPSADRVSMAERLVAGALLALPTWSRTDVRNEGKETASVLVLAASTLAVPDGAMSEPYPSPPDAQPRTDAGTGLTRWPAGVPQIFASGAIAAPLTGNVLTTLPGERAMVAVGRVTLAPGVMLPAFEAAGPHLLVVNKGTVELAAKGTAAPIARGTGSYLWAATLGAPAGALLHAGAIANLHNPGPGPAVVTIVAILPDERAGPAS